MENQYYVRCTSITECGNSIFIDFQAGEAGEKIDRTIRIQQPKGSHVPFQFGWSYVIHINESYDEIESK